MPRKELIVGSPRFAEAPLTRHGYWQLRPRDLFGRDDLRLVDIREEVELLSELGHVGGVLHWPAAKLRAGVWPPFDKAQPLALVCGDGRQSAEWAVWAVQRGGFREVYHLVGGMLRWNAEALPTARPPRYHRRPSRLPPLSAGPSSV